MMAGAERMPPLDPAVMNEAQRKAAQALAAGPRGGMLPARRRLRTTV
jgi:hypothetical protein